MKKLLSFSLAALLIQAANAKPVSGFAQTNDGQLPVEKVKADVARHSDKKHRVTVKLKDGSKLKGHISRPERDQFTLTDSKTGQTRTLAYEDVVSVKKQGGLSLAAKIGIGLAVVVGVLAILYGAACTNDPIC